MLNKLILAVLAFLSFITMGRFRSSDDKEAGAIKQQLEDTEVVLDDVHQADLIRDKLRAESDYAKRVHDRFTRPNK